MTRIRILACRLNAADPDRTTELDLPPPDLAPWQTEATLDHLEGVA